MGVGVYGCIHVVAIDTPRPSPAEVVYLQRENLKYYTFSAKETKQVKGAWGNHSQANLASSAIQFVVLTVTIPLRTGQRRGTYNTRNVPARHFAVPKSWKQQQEVLSTVLRRLTFSMTVAICDVISSWDMKSAKFKTHQMPFIANPLNFMHANIFRYTVID